MGDDNGSNVDSTQQNIEQLVKRIQDLQAKENQLQIALVEHEGWRNEMCPGALESQTGFDFFGAGTTTHDTNYQVPCCSKLEEEGASKTDRSDDSHASRQMRSSTTPPSGLSSQTSKTLQTAYDKAIDYGYNPQIVNWDENTDTWPNKDKDKDKKLHSGRGRQCHFEQAGGPEKSKQLLAQINSLATERTELFKTLMSIYANVQRDVSETRSDLVDQLTVVGVVEEELGNARTNLEALAGAKSNKYRMSEINTYYGKQYHAHTGIMKMIILICLPLLILAILGKKGYIGANITRPLALIVIIVGGYFLITRVWDLWWRDNMNYDEYNWDFDPASAKPTVYEYDKAQFESTGIGANISDNLHSFASDLGIECIGPNCCSKGMKYDQKLDKCVEKTAHEAKHEADVKKQVEAFEEFSPETSGVHRDTSGSVDGRDTMAPQAYDPAIGEHAIYTN